MQIQPKFHMYTYICIGGLLVLKGRRIVSVLLNLPWLKNNLSLFRHQKPGRKTNDKTSRLLSCKLYTINRQSWIKRFMAFKRLIFNYPFKTVVFSFGFIAFYVTYFSKYCFYSYHVKVYVPTTDIHFPKWKFFKTAVHSALTSY